MSAALVDAAERRRAVEDLDTTLLVEAAAGSGKTTLLLGRVVHIVRCGRARLREIAAITFTEKAAAELRIKLRGELERAGLHDALRELELARIGTIHAFAGSLLRERPVEAGVDPGFTVADPLAARLLRDATWDAWLEESIADAGAAEPVRRAIELGLPLEALRGLAFALAEERDQLHRLPGPAEPPEPLTGLNGNARAAIARLETLAREFAKDPGDRAAQAVRDLAAWARQTAGLPEAEQVRTLLAVGDRFPARADRLGNQAKWRDRAKLGECRETLRGLRERLDAARAVDRHNLAAALARWAGGFADAYQARKARAGCLDFQDLLLAARDLVRDHPDVRRDFQRQIRYLLVDEFQDTDPLQLEMILALADGAASGSLFIVGDPKQSIYRFRRADIETYEQAKAAIAARGEVLAIRANFRSGRALLDAVNQVFEGAMTPPADGAYQPAYVPLEPSPGTPAGIPPVVVQLPPDSAPALADDAQREEARLLAAYLRREVEAAGRFRYGDVALLFRAMTGVARYEDAFREARVPFRTVGGRHYYDRSEVGWVIAALAAVEDPHDGVALVGALRSPFFGLTDAALLRLVDAGGEVCYLRPLPAGVDPALAEAWALLRELHQDRNRVAPPALVERLYTRTQVLAAYALDAEGEARVANLAKVLDTARALEATGALTFRALVRWLRDQGAARYEEEESVIAEEDEDVVRLMTIHKAKGLEFPVVIVPDLCRDAPPRPGPVLGDRISGTLAVNVGLVDETPVSTLNWEALAARETRRLEAESLRLLYVALTRARSRVVLPVPTRVEPKGFFPYLGPMLDGPAETIALLDDAPVAPPDHEPVVDSLAAWRADRAALLARAAAGESVVRPSAAELPPRGGERDGRRLGALVHAALAAVVLDRPGEAPAVVAALGRRQGASPELVAAATRRVRRLLASPLLERARRATWRAREVAVTAELDGTLVDGRVDLLFEEEGALVVVEFKSDGDPDSGQDQAALYAAAVERALGRPVRETVVVRLA